MKLLVALIAIVDIPGDIPIFLQQTARFAQWERLVAATTAAAATCLILAAFALMGEEILGAFGVAIAAFKCFGGLVVLLIGLDMLGLFGGDGGPGAPGPDDHGPIVVGVFPLAVPLFAGPGAITAVMVYAHEDFHADQGAHDLVVLAVVISACAALALGLALASFLGRVIGPVAQIVMNKLLGMIVGALGVEFVLEGLLEFYPALGAVAPAATAPLL